MTDRRMRRRAFVKGAAAAGLLAAVPSIFRRGLAQDATFGGPYWLFIQAAGGWDPRFMFDPTLNPEQNRLYGTIGQIGNVAYAPIALDLERLGWDPALAPEQHVRTAEAFLQKHGARLTVVNGIDTTTNSHDSGRRAMGSGRISDGHPSLAALIAAAQAPDMPIAFFSGGGFDATEGLVPLTRVANAGALLRIVRPNAVDPNNLAGETFHTPETFDRITRFQRERGDALRTQQHLPAIERSMAGLLDARASTHVLDRLALPELVTLANGDLGDMEGFMRQGQLALAAFGSGLTATATLSFGGFDTHGNHDRDQVGKVVKLLGGIDFILDQAAALGLDGRLYVVVSSDFGRGPAYNGMGDGSGKDHWPISSLFALGPGIAGDRVVGATDDGQLARPVDPGTLQPSDAGVKIGPEHVHRALRRLAGVHEHELAVRYALPGADLPLFG